MSLINRGSELNVKIKYLNFSLCIIALLTIALFRQDVQDVRAQGPCDPLEIELLSSQVEIASTGSGEFGDYNSSVSLSGNVLTVSMEGTYSNPTAYSDSFILGQQELFTNHTSVDVLYVHARALTFSISGSSYLTDGSYMIIWNCAGDNCNVQSPDSLSGEAENGESFSWFQMVMFVDAYETVDFTLTWEISVVTGEDCSYPGDPIPIPEVAMPWQLLAVPDGCDGIEVLPTSWGLVPPDANWLNSTYNYYGSQGYTVRWTFRAETGRSFSANVTTNGFLLGLSWYGPSTGEDMYYEVTWPSTFTDDPTTMSVRNTGANSIMIASICIQPVRTTGQCLNDDAEFNNPSVWAVGAPAYINNGALNLLRTGWAQQQQYLGMGSYRIQFTAEALPSGTNQQFELYVGSDLYRQVVVPSSGAPVHFWYDFNITASNPILTLAMNSTAAPDASVRFQYICISLLAAATPTPPPQPTPTRVPPPQSCNNPSYNFNIPDLWTLAGGSMIVPEEGTGRNLLLLNGGAWQQLEVPQGQYVLTVRARRGISGGSPAGFGVDFGYTPMGEWVINPSVPIQQPVEYMATKYIMGGTHYLNIYILPGYAYGGTIESICFSYAGNPNPQPTPTVGPTPTPEITPWPDPAYCINPDSGIDTNSTWIVIGSGYISGSQAYLNAGDQLAADIEIDAVRDYDVSIAGYCTANGTANVYWRNQMQTLLCVGGGLPFNRTFTFPPEPVTFVSSPLVDLLQPGSGDAIPEGLPRGFAPQLFNSPLGLPLPPTSDPLYSPLAEPEFPDANAAEALALMLANVLQIQASNGNGGQIIVTSVCVKNREWVPPAEPPNIELYYPVCERDWAIQRGWSDSHPAMLVGLGAQAGMPVHAMYGGYVTAVNSTFTFGGVTYNGCVTIDHTATLGADLQSLYCSMDEFAVGTGNTVARGQLLGYTADVSYGLFGSRGNGLALIGVYLNDVWVNPMGYFSGYVDCHPYRVIIEPVEKCTADDGSGSIPPRYNMPAPSIWQPEQWVPWLSRRLYDTVGYPILCALVPIFNALMTIIQDIANSIITVLTAPLLFIYRIGRIFEYLLALFGRVLTAILNLFDSMSSLAICFRSIVTYFISAMTAAREAERPALELSPGPLLYTINLTLLLVSSTVANAILVPVVGLLIAYASWKLIPWGIKNIRSAVGAGE